MVEAKKSNIKKSSRKKSRKSSKLNTERGKTRNLGVNVKSVTTMTYEDNN